MWDSRSNDGANGSQWEPMGDNPTQAIHHKMQLWGGIIHHIFPIPERGAAMLAHAIPICTKCKREIATSTRKEVLCEPCAAKVRGAEAARKRAGDKKRKGELLTAKQSRWRYHKHLQCCSSKPCQHPSHLMWCTGWA